jgi:hypothetical protein
MNFKETQFEDMDWIHLAQDRINWCIVMNTVLNLWVPWKRENFMTSLATVLKKDSAP